MNVKKRDGKIVSFQQDKIKKAIISANSNVDKQDKISDQKIEDITQHIVNQINLLYNRNNDLPTDSIDVEQIQDLVEQALIFYNCDGVIQLFHDYRKQREKERFKRLEITKQINEKLAGLNIENQNANVDEASFGGRIGECDSALLKQMALDYYMSPKFAKLHIDNIVYQHDLDRYTIGNHNCLAIPIDQLLANGFITRQTDVRPAGNINTAFQLVAVLFQIQSLQQFGGVAASHIDFSMVPYVRKTFMKHYITEYIKQSDDFQKFDFNKLIFENFDEEIEDDGKILYITHNKFDDFLEKYKHEFFNQTKLTEKDFRFDNKNNLDKNLYNRAIFETIKDTAQACEGLFHNLNTLQSRSGNQLPFTSINYGTCTCEEGRLVIKSLLEAQIKGVGLRHTTAIFPCTIFLKKKGINDKGSINYDLYQLAIKSTTLRLYPNYGNCDWSVQKSGIKKDREIKQKVLDKLSNEQKEKLIKIIEEKPEIGLALNLKIVN